MQRIVLLLLGMASLAASGIITDRIRGGLDMVAGLGIGLQGGQGLQGSVHHQGIGPEGMGSINVNTLNQQQLLRQKFILDVLQQVNMPIQNRELLVLVSRNDVTNEDLYTRPLTEDMLMVLDLIRQQQILNKQQICTISNDRHVQQMVGLYRLLVGARDFEAFQQLVVYARQHVNTEMFVNALILALAERQDTEMLVVPALHEVLPQLYHHQSIIQQVQHLDTGVSSLRPNLVDVVGLGRQNRLLNNRLADEQQNTGLLGILNRSQMWMPWRELHRQMAIRRMAGGNVIQQTDRQMNKLVVQLPGQGLLTDDIGLKAYVNVLVDELIVKQDVVGRSGDRNMNMGTLRGMGGIRGLRNRIRNTLNVNDNDDDDDQDNDNIGWSTNNQRRRIVNTGRMDRLFNVERSDDDIFGGRRTGLNMDQDRTSMGGRMGRVGLNRDDINVQERLRQMQRNNDNDDDDDENVYTGGRTIMGRNEHQRGRNTVSVNDPRLLFVGRRRKNPNNVINLSGSNRNYNTRNYMDRDDMDMISGGRRTDRNERQQNSWQVNERDDDDILANRRMNNQRRMQNDNDNDDDMIQGQWQDQQRMGQGIGGGHGRNDFLKVVTRGGHMIRDTNVRGRDMQGGQRGDSLDMNLPTTSIDDERLLYVNRRKLNENINTEGRRMWNNNDDDDDDNDNDDVRRQRTRNNWMTGNRRNMWNEDEENIHVGGRRYRRSLDQQQQNWGQNWNRDETTGINGKLLLHTLQQLVARINVERIALGLPQLIDDQSLNRQQQKQGILGRIAERRNANTNIDITSRVSGQTLNKIEEIMQRIDRVLQQQVQQGQQQTLSATTNYNDILNQIGLLLAGQVEDINLVDLMGEVLQHSENQLRKGQVANIIDNENIQILLAGIVKVIDDHVQELIQNRQHITGQQQQQQDININNVQIDKLQTYLEQTEVDLSNLAQDNIDLSMQGNNRMIVGQVPRLNHKNFHIDIEVTSQRQQQVVVRSMLVPKVDGRGNTLPVNQRRQNAILLDITTVDLHQGRNLVKLHSNDITLTGCDTTPYTKIYERVMLALERQTQMGQQQQQICGQTDMMPHRLLVPRGRVNGLPMQLVTVITPVQNTLNTMGRPITGLDVLLLDRLPLNYPLHSDITDLDQVNAMPNVLVKDVQIYHDDNIQLNLMNLN